MQPGVYFITGIDTDIGKTISTGLLARWLLQSGESTITQKLVQTGCTGMSEDLIVHRELMGVDLFAEDVSHVTCPYLFHKPCSPHLAAERETVSLDPHRITAATRELATCYDYVLLEGAGGLCAPLTRHVSTIDYVAEKSYPVILVSSSRLGSLHHTNSLLELAHLKGIEISGVIYNRYGEHDNEIGDDSRIMIKEAMQKFGFMGPIIDMTEDGISAQTLRQCPGLFGSGLKELGNV